VEHRIPQVTVDSTGSQTGELLAVQVTQPLGDRVRRLGQQDLGFPAAEKSDCLLQDLDAAHVEKRHLIQVKHRATMTAIKGAGSRRAILGITSIAAAATRPTAIVVGSARPSCLSVSQSSASAPPSSVREIGRTGS
jgi:hypothetical protein